MFITLAVDANAVIVLDAEPVPTNVKPATQILKPLFEGIPTMIFWSGAVVEPNSIVNATVAADVFVAYNQTSSMIVALVPVACIVVPVVAVATTLMGIPPVEPLNNVFAIGILYFLFYPNTCEINATCNSSTEPPPPPPFMILQPLEIYS